MTEDFITEHPIIDAIRDWLCNRYGLIYTKHFKLYLDDEEYAIGIEQGNFERPIVIGGQFENDNQFVLYFEKEFALKQLYRIPLFSAAKAQTDELDSRLFFINEKGEECETELVENRQIRQIQNEHNS